MASLRGPLAAVVRASSRRESGLAARGSAGRKAILVWCRGGAPPSLPSAGVRGLSSAPNQPPRWTWDFVRAKADQLHDAAFTSHGVLLVVCSTSAGFAVYYVDGAIAEERRLREGFEVTAVKGHQDHVGRTIANIEDLKEKMGKFWDRFLAYREDDMEYRDAVTKAADMLKKKGYIVVPASEFVEMKSKIAELTDSMSEIQELKAKLGSLALGHEKQTDFGEEKKHGDGGISNSVPPVVSAVKKQADSGKEKKHGVAGISNGAPPVISVLKGSGDADEAISDGVHQVVADTAATKKTSKTGSWFWW